MKIKGKVLNQSCEKRELVNKDGVKEQKVVTTTMIQQGGEFFQVRSYNDYPTAEVGKDHETLPIRKMEMQGAGLYLVLC